jgi:hypothetical protein
MRFTCLITGRSVGRILRADAAQNRGFRNTNDPYCTGGIDG